MTVITLRRGTIGDDVRSMQFELYTLGYDTLAIDGIFGPKTELAVRDFQGKMGLKVDGIVGPKTWAAIYDNLQRAGRYDLLEQEKQEPEAKVQTPEPKAEKSEYGYLPPQDDGEITLPNEPVKLWYPAGQRLVLSREMATDLSQKIQQRLVYDGGDIEVIAGTGWEATVTAVAACNIYQQIKEVGSVG